MYCNWEDLTLSPFVGLRQDITIAAKIGAGIVVDGGYTTPPDEIGNHCSVGIAERVES